MRTKENTIDGIPIHETMQCFVRKIEYDFALRAGKVTMTAGDCASMTGAIATFKAIDPDVRSIETFRENKPDTAYVLKGGKWEAFCLRHLCAPAAEG